MKNSVLCYLEETAKKYPDKLAITDGKNSVTFSEWRKRALCVADYIEKKVNKNRCPILIYLPKGIDTLVSFAAVLYSRNYYTPTDVEFPSRKIRGILDVLHPEVVISTHALSLIHIF